MFIFSYIVMVTNNSLETKTMLLKIHLLCLYCIKLHSGYKGFRPVIIVINTVNIVLSSVI